AGKKAKKAKKARLGRRVRPARQVPKVRQAPKVRKAKKATPEPLGPKAKPEPKGKKGKPEQLDPPAPANGPTTRLSRCGVSAPTTPCRAGTCRCSAAKR